MRPGAVLRELLHEGEPAEDAAALLLRVLENTGGQRSDADLTDVQAAVREGLEPLIVGGEEFFDDAELLFQDRQFTGGGGVQLTDREHVLPGQRYRDVAGRSPGDVVDEDPEPAVRGIRALVAGRVQQAEVGNALLRSEQAGIAQDVLDLGDLGACRQAVRGGCVCVRGRHGGLWVGARAGGWFIFYSCRE